MSSPWDLTMTWEPGTFFAWNHQSFPDAKEKVSSSFWKLFFSYIHIIAVAGNIVERHTFEFLFFLCEFPADITALCQLFL